ncbi:hypothetical protein [Actinomadura parmotrematis]|uniref:Uncharacterized protein n=1 Tax=Actinomadura parmotrematis TaxID=2864039 RepID=A0ABS7FVN2_9ACTN|nr:hypothetical protein [Actinomadura parmotrematis]MBW8484240.1 hypothetical protein [Actinomadura parmotrematis]
MNETTFHLTHAQLHGPAERTLVEPRLSALAHQTLNAYAEPTAPAAAAVPPVPAPGALSLAEALTTARQIRYRPRHELAA